VNAGKEEAVSSEVNAGKEEAVSSEVNANSISLEDIENTSNKIDVDKSKLLASNRLRRSLSDPLKEVKEETNDLSGRNIDKLIKMKNLAIRDEEWSTDRSNKFTFSFDIPQDVRANDYFAIELPEETRPLSSDRTNGIYLGTDKNNIYARGIYDSQKNRFVFEFTDKAPNFKGTNVDMSLLLLVNRTGIKESGVYNLNFKIGDEEYNSLKPNIQISNVVNKRDLTADETAGDKVGDVHEYTGTYNVNSLGKTITNAQIKFEPYIKESDKENAVSQYNKDVTKFKVYKVNDINTLHESGNPDGVNKTDVTETTKIEFNDDGTATITLGDINSPYIIIADNKTTKLFDVGNSLQTKVTLTGNNIEPIETTYNTIKRAPSESNSSGLVVDDTTPPEVDKIKDQKPVEAGKPIEEIAITGKDNGGGPLTHEVTGLPE
ncbi:Ig-like domain-containing protein, partial [Staphylococcus agnetis]|uniref:Ig-like domain-containing protein n=1 Tax=Staphylococcus agnetis TaxID=985762 RepID=UPI00208FAF10